MKQLELTREVLAAIATLRGVSNDQIRVSIGERVELTISANPPVEIDESWSPEGGGIVQRLDLAAALAHHVRDSARRHVYERERAVADARSALARAEKEHAAAVALRDRLASIVEEGVALARAENAEKTNGS